jgi:hypothetical protein
MSTSASVSLQGWLSLENPTKKQGRKILRVRFISVGNWRDPKPFGAEAFSSFETCPNLKRLAFLVRRAGFKPETGGLLL